MATPPAGRGRQSRTPLTPRNLCSEQNHEAAGFSEYRQQTSGTNATSFYGPRQGMHIPPSISIPVDDVSWLPGQALPNDHQSHQRIVSAAVEEIKALLGSEIARINQVRQSTCDRVSALEESLKAIVESHVGAVTGANSEKSSKRRRITPLSLQVSIQLHFCLHTIFVPPFEKMKIRKLHEAFGEDCRLKTDEP